MCFAQHANTSTNKPLRKQAEPWDFAHKDFFKKERKEKDGSNGRTSFVAERTFPTRCGKRGPALERVSLLFLAKGRPPACEPHSPAPDPGCHRTSRCWGCFGGEGSFWRSV